MKERASIKGHLKRTCSVCGAKMSILIFDNKTYTGGHYFGKIPVASKKEWKKAMNSGTHTSKKGNLTIEVMNRDPKPYKHIDMWECENCYQKAWLLEKRFEKKSLAQTTKPKGSRSPKSRRK